MTNETQKLEILVVEDNPKHLEDARSELARLQASGVQISASYATNYLEAQKAIQSKTYRGIISDIFFPSGYNASEQNVDMTLRQEIANTLVKAIENGGTRESLTKWMNAIGEWKSGKGDAPLGVALAEAYATKMPFVFCTSTYHHGVKTEPVNRYAAKKIDEQTGRGIPICDALSENSDGESSQKPWKIAYETLLPIISRRNQSSLVSPPKGRNNSQPTVGVLGGTEE